MSQDYVNIFATSNCSLISGLIPPGVKKFVNAFMAGNLLRNPLSQVMSVFGDQIGSLMGRLGDMNNLIELTEDLQKLNNRLNTLEQKLQEFRRHTNILSGVARDPERSLDQIIGVMSAYNSMKDVLKDPGAQLQDNFSNAFSSLNPRIVGPFFENFSDNMNEVERLLGEVSYQITTNPDGTGITAMVAPANFLNEVGQLAGNIGDLTNTMDSLIKGDERAYAIAAAALADYALANGLIGSLLSDPCFGAQVIANLITQPDARNDLLSIAGESGIDIKNGFVDFSGLLSESQADRSLLQPIAVNVIPPPPSAESVILSPGN